MADNPKRSDTALAKTNTDLKALLQKVLGSSKLGKGTALKEGVDYQKNAKGGIQNEVGAFIQPLADLDTWYSIVASSVIGHGMNRFARWQRPATTTFFRELLTFTLYELIAPKLSGFVPRLLIDDGDIDKHR